MKSLIHKILLLSFVSLVLWSCKKDEVKSVAAENGTGSTLTTSTTAPVLNKETQEEDAITISFTKSDFGFKAAAKNILQLAVAGTSFSAPKEVPFDANVLTKTYTGMDFNLLLLALDLPFDKESDIEIRIKSEVGDKVNSLYSNVVKLKVKPYPLITWIYVPGNYQGWNPPTADSLISGTGNGVYTGIIYFPKNLDNNYEFKITPAKAWAVAYGDAGGGNISTTGGNLKAPEAGSYRLTVDLNLLTIEIKKDSWGIIGNATPGGWDNDTDMIYNNTANTWSVTLPLIVGEYKFRYNDDWGTNLGGKDGVLTPGGANIKVNEAGTYKVVIDTNNNTYTITKQ